MSKHRAEILAGVVVVIILVLLPILVFAYGPWQNSEGKRVIHLTAISKTGIWTDEEVTGLNYWNKDFKKAHIILKENEEVIFKFSSADVTHTFYVPELNLGPVNVDAGHTVEVVFKPKKRGQFIYYCTTVCGDCHFYMQGEIVVLAEDEDFDFANNEEYESSMDCTIHNMRASDTSFLSRGKFIFEQKGCITCHGQGGKGGIYNPNYVNKYVPQLDDIAEKLKIYWEEDAEIVINLLEAGVNFKELETDPPIDNFHRFIAQYESIINKIHDGTPDLQLLDPEGPVPPLNMPSWNMQLSEKEINSVLAYLINEFDWEDY